jgi:hypothetical protein
MKRPLTNIMILAGSIAALSACDRGKQVERESQDLSQTQQETVKEQAELTREQRQEQADLQNEQARDMAHPNAIGTDNPAERAEERADLSREQAEERARLSQRQSEKMREEQKDLAEAKQEANEQRADIVKDSRDKLADLDERAQKLRDKLAQANAQEQTEVRSALTPFSGQRQAIERDIEALDSVREANLSRTKEKLQKHLSALDTTLDRAESKL